ncbi:20132_t:CDS:1, partial [Gigaspora margarita]
EHNKHLQQGFNSQNNLLLSNKNSILDKFQTKEILAKKKNIDKKD